MSLGSSCPSDDSFSEFLLLFFSSGFSLAASSAFGPEGLSSRGGSFTSSAGRGCWKLGAEVCRERLIEVCLIILRRWGCGTEQRFCNEGSNGIGGEEVGWR